nr:CocE/NonD family hydrolase [Hyphomicrobium sp.]
LRGTGDSGGELMPWAHATEDAVDTVNWIAKQPWSNGRVGTYGCSALGETQLVAQHAAPDAWRAMIVSGGGGAVGSLDDRHTYGFFEGGIFQLASGFGWFVDSGSKRPDAAPAMRFDRAAKVRELPIAGLVESVRPAASGYTEYMNTPFGDPKWREWGFLGNDSRMRVPTLVINTWGDQTLQDTLALAEHWTRADPEGTHGRQKVIITPGKHCGHDEAGQTEKFGALKVANAALSYRQIYLKWFDYWLRGEGDALSDMSPYTYYVVGADAWRTSESWPPAESKPERWYLGSSGSANSRDGNGTLALSGDSRAASDTLRYDPNDPVPTRGGPICCTGNHEEPQGPVDQADVEVRKDVLVYTTAPMTSDMWIAGPLKATLVVSSDAKDTDLVARLVHVWPDGRATSIQEGALRLRYRDGFTSPKLLNPGESVRVTVDMRSIAYRIPKGHRLRLDVTSSCFPRLERNLNTGSNNFTETNSVVATNTIHYGLAGGSWLELPILPSPQD